MALDLSSLGAMQGYGQASSANMAKAIAGDIQAPADTNAVTKAVEEFASVFDKADGAVSAMARGEGSAQAVVEAMAQAELALQTVVTIRDRVIEAYQEILRMPV
ncbi:flagellar hook-basal body complex protein FliE [Parvularcula sp. LCG005]|uniref:flagellar hook-basal body complex protein FliE n=1 Tax=Parvularcula sp. LCG005 TaxID=3078805 RepID=UPI0029427058|nr:flagellar hook-basal body complex protein FliE [Parvularcula sp. LCG005]WOI52677.1 flagellar hook-basal body complex protein FliE [Parvularcula sp. LCG005]